MRRPAPPSGDPPPAVFELPDGREIDLGTLAARACDLYFETYRDDIARYGPPGRAWCDHDTRYLLAWSLEDARAGTVDCVEQVRWLGRVLAVRSFDIRRFVHHVELTALVLDTSGLGEIGDRAADRLRASVDAVLRDHAR